MLEMYISFGPLITSLTIQSKLFNTIIILCLILVQHSLFSCDNSFSLRSVSPFSILYGFM